MPRSSFPFRSCLCGVIASALGAACTVGPDYRGAPPVASEAVQAATFHRAPAQAEPTAPAAADWWRQLGDAQLDALIESALANSPDIHAAQARLRQARAALRGHESNALPKGSMDAVYLRARSPDTALLKGQPAGSSGRGPIGFYAATFDASWEIDLFGGTRRAIEAAAAEADAVEADLADAHVELAAEVARNYVILRDNQQRRALASESAELEERILALTEQRRGRGVASELDVERVRTQAETTRASILPLEVQISEAMDQLAVLTGRAPGALDAELAAPRALPAVPEAVAVGDPAALLRNRPDIRAAERRLASQQAQIGERVADWFPKLTLFGSLGFAASDPGHLVRKENFTWVGAPYLQWNVLDFGRVRAGVDQAEAGRDMARAKYESTVLGALRDANTALSRYGHQRDYVIELSKIESSAARTAGLTQQRYKAGTTTALDWLDAERTRLSAQQNRIAGDAQLVGDFVALQKSLGLGWQQ